MTPEEDFFCEKSAASGGTRTHDTLLSRLSPLPTELLMYHSWLGRILQCYSNQGKGRQSMYNVHVQDYIFKNAKWGRRLKAVCVYRISRGASGFQGGANAPHPRPPPKCNPDVHHHYFVNAFLACCMHIRMTKSSIFLHPSLHILYTCP